MNPERVPEPVSSSPSVAAPRRAWLVPSAMALLLFPLGGCSSSSTAPGTALDNGQLQTVVSAIFQTAVARAVEESPLALASADGPSAASVSVDSEAIGSVQCPLGGEVETFTEIDGSYDDASSEASLDFFTELDHVGCLLESPDSGEEIEIDGAPGIQASFFIERTVDGFVSGEGGLIGTVRVVTEGANLNCRMNVGVRIAGEDENLEYEIVGSFCEIGVQATIGSGP